LLFHSGLQAKKPDRNEANRRWWVLSSTYELHYANHEAWYDAGFWNVTSVR
jgi:hypothetical protein